MKPRSWIIKPRRPASVRPAPPSVWGRHAEQVYGVHPDRLGARWAHAPYTPINKSLAAPPPDRVADGFTMFPSIMGGAWEPVELTVLSGDSACAA